MSVLKDRADALLYLLDFMVGIDQRLDDSESDLFIQTAFKLLQNDFAGVQEKIKNIARLWREYDRNELFEEACDFLKREGEVESSLHLLRQMAAADGKIDPAEQELFEQICARFGVTPDTLQL